MYTLPVALSVWALCHVSSVNGFVAREDPTKAAGAVSAVVTPSLSIGKIAGMTTCQPAFITWLYSPASTSDFSDLTLSITNAGVAQPPAPSSTATGIFTPNVGRTVHRRDLLTQQIVTGLDPTLRTFTWASVNVTAGWYEIIATLPLYNVVQLSPSFYVQNGTDVSCFAPASSPSSTSSSLSNPTSSGTPTSSGGTSQSSGATLPVAAASSKVNRGAIAGGVIGGLAVIAAAIAAYFYLRYASASTASGAASGKRGTRKWAGLGSTDSKARAYPSASRSTGAGSGRHHSQSDSIGPMLDNSVYVIGNVGIDSRTSRIHDVPEEEDEVNFYFTPSQEKISSPAHGSPLRSPFSESGHDHEDAMPMDLVTPLPGSAVTRNSSTSTSSYMNNNFSRPRSHPSSPYGSPTTAEGPFSDNARNNTNSSLSHQESSYPPTPSPAPAFPSGVSAALEGAPPRRGSAGEPLAAPTRRTPRKPVPQYIPTDVTPQASLTPLPAGDSDSSREGSMRSGRVGGGLQDLPRLNHKGSFGTEGRPVHYLIPDMPPPQRD